MDETVVPPSRIVIPSAKPTPESSTRVPPFRVPSAGLNDAISEVDSAAIYKIECVDALLSIGVHNGKFCRTNCTAHALRNTRSELLARHGDNLIGEHLDGSSSSVDEGRLNFTRGAVPSPPPKARPRIETSVPPAIGPSAGVTP